MMLKASTPPQSQSQQQQTAYYVTSPPATGLPASQLQSPPQLPQAVEISTAMQHMIASPPVVQAAQVVSHPAAGGGGAAPPLCVPYHRSFLDTDFDFVSFQIANFLI